MATALPGGGQKTHPDPSDYALQITQKNAKKRKKTQIMQVENYASSLHCWLQIFSDISKFMQKFPPGGKKPPAKKYEKIKTHKNCIWPAIFVNFCSDLENFGQNFPWGAKYPPKIVKKVRKAEKAQKKLQSAEICIAKKNEKNANYANFGYFGLCKKRKLRNLRFLPPPCTHPQTQTHTHTHTHTHTYTYI